MLSAQCSITGIICCLRAYHADAAIVDNEDESSLLQIPSAFDTSFGGRKQLLQKANTGALGRRGAGDHTADSHPCGDNVHGWPQFESAADLENDAGWRSYFQAVYGEIPKSGYPICISDFWLLYPMELQRAGITPPEAAPVCPQERTNGAFYQRNTGAIQTSAESHERGDYSGSFPGASWILHLPPYAPSPDGVWTEIIHYGMPEYASSATYPEKFGAYFFLAKGSGIWFNLGRTLSFDTHWTALHHFKISPDNLPCAHCKDKIEDINGTLTGARCSGKIQDIVPWVHTQCLEELARKSAAENYDSLQFLNWRDKGSCNYCCDQMGIHHNNIEVVATKLVGDYTCAEPPGGSQIRAGWMGSRPCGCTEGGHSYINCAGVPHSSG